ncbi:MULTISPECIES: ABC transporter ATP-binding protein [unclassified Methanoregula]|uniref:ABC transporter ATP-binding protein n=1 Tax=unclassified Methanoregula TaxID=2649730 RepID=UPI0009CC18FA|nr:MULTISPECIES: ABC transporter ATP-binding protein [unclassified Methanoregula]OPX64155.1 MAG: putative ABC transporter ATP-binding protein [Methanoregula sp. PtaB.Bin085]OPY34725.1 MAG: putative ABC transporter ATP-binding protein [Methanoregula sp. PtaU1.Bin006]
MIRTTNLTKTYYPGVVEVPALRGISFEVRRGDFLGLMGPSGSGKSTLLHLLGLLDFPTSGTIEINSHDVADMDDDERTDYRLRKMGYIFQDYALVAELTVLENVMLTVMAQGKTEDECREASREVLSTVGLSHRLGHLPRELSGGEQQRVAIARSMVNRPIILFADEPCANLDTVNSKAVLDQFHTLNEEFGQTIVMVSHEEWHKDYFHRIVYLKDGQIDRDEDRRGH